MGGMLLTTAMSALQLGLNAAQQAGAQDEAKPEFSPRLDRLNKRRKSRPGSGAINCAALSPLSVPASERRA